MMRQWLSRFCPALPNPRPRALCLGYGPLPIGYWLLVIGHLFAASPLSAADGSLLGYLPITGPGLLRFQEPLPAIAILPPLPFDSRDLANNTTTNLSLDKTSQPANSASEPEPFWRVPLLPPDSASSPETNALQLTSASPVTEVLTLDTNSPVVTPQMLVPFFRPPAPGTNSGGLSLIMPLNSLPLN